MEPYRFKGLVALVMEPDRLRSAHARALEQQGWVVLELDDGAELADYVDLVTETGRRMPRKVVADAEVAGPHPLDTCEEARRKGLDWPFVVLTDEVTPSLQARAAGLRDVSFAPKSVAQTSALQLDASHT